MARKSRSSRKKPSGSDTAGKQDVPDPTPSKDDKEWTPVLPKQKPKKTKKDDDDKTPTRSNTSSPSSPQQQQAKPKGDSPQSKKSIGKTKDTRDADNGPRLSFADVAKANSPESPVIPADGVVLGKPKGNTPADNDKSISTTVASTTKPSSPVVTALKEGAANKPATPPVTSNITKEKTPAIPSPGNDKPNDGIANTNTRARGLLTGQMLSKDNVSPADKSTKPSDTLVNQESLGSHLICR